MTKKQTWAIAMVLLFFIWGGISYQWYACGIKGFCDAPQKTAVIEKKSTEQCGEYISEHIKLGALNNPDEVRKLEGFLNQFEGASLSIDGTYDAQDELVVKQFQRKYTADILDPWGMKEATGFVYKTTRNKINEIYCAGQHI